MRKAFILLIIASMLSMAIADTLAVPTTTIGVEPVATLDPILEPGSTFAVEIWVRDVVDLAGVEFKLGYDTSILTATTIAYGGIFGGTYFPLTSKIYDSSGYLHYAIMEMFGEPGFTGDGQVATITFTVDSEGESILALYDTRLGNSAAQPIDHTAIDGFSSSRWPSGTLPSDVYVGLNTALIGDRHLKIAKDGTTQTLTGQIENMGLVPVKARVHFKVLLLGAPIPGGDLMSTVDPILPGQTLRLSVSLDVTTLDRPAQYNVEIWVEYYGFAGWTLGRHGDPDGAKTTIAASFKLED